MKILAFAGSARAQSFNKRLLCLAVRELEQRALEVNVYDFAAYPLPLYDGDLEAAEGLPPHARRFKDALIAHDGFIIASPEYNSAYSPLLKNALDWASRASAYDEAPLLAYKGKPAALIATSPGNLGGLRGLAALRMLLTNIGVNVLPRQLAVPKAHEVFRDNESQAGEGPLTELISFCDEFVEYARRFSAH
ncbi:MAG: NADPH-dependent FMN reductase [Gammaproteobacteria bacterium]